MATPAEKESTALRGGPTLSGNFPYGILAASARIEEKSIPDVAVLTTGASPFTLFNVTGNVIAKVFAVSGAALASTGTNGTLAVGVSGATSGYLGAVTINGTNFPAAGTVWAGDSTVTLLGKVLSAVALTGFIQSATPIIATIATNSLTTGSIKFYCLWYPLSSDGSVTAA